MTVRIPSGDLKPDTIRVLEMEFKRITEEYQTLGGVLVARCATSATLPAPVRDGIIRVATSGGDPGTIAVSPDGTYWYDIINAVTIA